MYDYAAILFNMIRVTSLVYLMNLMNSKFL